jgi:hypothetical protein
MVELVKDLNQDIIKASKIFPAEMCELSGEHIAVSELLRCAISVCLFVISNV